MRASLHHQLRAISQLRSPPRRPHSNAAAASACDEVLSILEAAGPIERALEDVAPHLSSGTVKSVLLRQRDPGLRFRFFIWAMRLKHLRCWNCYDLAVDMLVRDDGFDHYWGLLEELRRQGIPIDSDAFALLISGYSRLGKTEKAVEAFERMRRDFDCDPNVYTFNKMLHLVVQKDVFLLALALYNKMSNKSECLPNVATYTILLHGFCRSGQITYALNVFEDMAKRGISPNQMTYTSLISGLCRSRNTADAYSCFESMRSRGCVPDTATFNALLDGFCKSGKVDDILMRLPEFTRDGYAFGLKGYSSVIDGLFRLRRDDEAESWYKKMAKDGIEPDIVLYGIMIRGFSKAGRFRSVMDMIKDMTQKGILPNTHCYNALIKGFCDAGLLDEARSLQLKISRPDASTYTILICEMCRNGLVDGAQKIFSEMEKNGCRPSVVTFNALMDGLCKAGDLGDAGVLLYKMEIGPNPTIFLKLSQVTNRVLDAETLTEKVEQLCESGYILKAYRLLTRVANGGAVPDITTYNILINGFSKSGKVHAAYKLFEEELTRKGLVPDSVTYGTLIDGLQRADKEKSASKVLDKMVESECALGPNIYKTLMTWSSRKAKVSLTFSLWLEYLQSIPDLDEGMIESAKEHFERGEVEKTVQTLVDLTPNDFDPGFYTILQFGLCEAGRTDDALRIFSALKGHRVNLSPPSCVKLIQCLCNEGNLGPAVEVFLYTLERGLLLKPRICNQLLLALLRSRHSREALDLIGRMKASGYNLDTHLFDATKDLLFSHSGSIELERAAPG